MLPSRQFPPVVKMDDNFDADFQQPPVSVLLPTFSVAWTINRFF